MTDGSRFALSPMRPRDPNQEHRAASPLELFFDLVFVVAVSFASVELAHMIEENHVAEGVLAYLLVFFAIWWAWMNFTWFATSFDTDDWLYRVTTIVQMAGVLVLAAGVSDAMNDSDFTLVTIGYVIMRLAMVSQWLRAAHRNPEYRRTATMYAAGITAVQVLWILRLFLPDSLALIGFFVLVVAEIAVPAISERSRQTPLHSEHIAERYGLFTLILLGESLLASATAIVGAIQEDEHLVALGVLAVAGLVIVAGMWWIYFAVPQHDSIGELRKSLAFGYTHYFIFAAAGAVSAGIEVAVAHIVHEGELSDLMAAASLTVPVALFVFAFWALALRPRAGTMVNLVAPIGAVVIAASTFLPGSTIVTAVVTALIVVAVVLEPIQSRQV
ncbi:low temperature requirement protein A [Actinomycetes bacterium M1A6_2h]